jgi:hypothetical protein
VGDGLRRPARFRPLAAILWTVAVGALLLAVDRVLLSPTVPASWMDAETLEAVPAEVGAMAIPTYLPDSLGWPPARVVYRVAAGRAGWWLGLSPPSGGETRLWLGSSGADAGEVVGEAAPCLEGETPTCPPGWQARRVQLDDGSPVVVLGRLPTEQLDRLVESLRPGARPRSARARPGPQLNPP